MLRKIIIKKIIIIVIPIFIILTIFSIPYVNKENVKRTELEIEDITNINTDSLYLLNRNNLLVKVDVFIDSKTINEKIEKIVKYLETDNTNIPQGLNAYIPNNTKILNLSIEDNILILDLSKDFLKYEKEKENIIISGLINSLLELKEIKGIKLLVENNIINNYSDILTKKIGINNEYGFNNRNEIDKVVIYYVDRIGEDTYFVPVSKYINDKREKIEIIIDELKNNKEKLISYLNSNTKLINYKEEGDILYLNFNSFLKEENKEKEDELINMISYSVFDNYDVSMVIFQIEGNNYKEISK